MKEKLHLTAATLDPFLAQASQYEKLWYYLDQQEKLSQPELLIPLIAMLNLHIKNLSEASGESTVIQPLMTLLSELRTKSRETMAVLAELSAQTKTAA